MRRVALVSCIGALAASSAAALDLSAIERKIDKPPALESKQPLYCLLVFGPEAKTRVWLVRDGDVMYVDRNANGDLTEPGERVEREPNPADPEARTRAFLLGDLLDGALTHKALSVRWFNVEHMQDSDPDVAARLKQEPDFLALSVNCDVAMPGFKGRGIEGRVEQNALVGDTHGLLDFSTSPETAPILHFGGPWQATLAGKGTLRIGRQYELYLIMGTPGLGLGTTVSTAYSGVIPEGANPRLEFKFATPDGGTLERAYDFKRRCCQVNLYDEVALPEGIQAGEAEVRISLDAWSEGHVAPTTHRIKLLPALPGPKLLPVSARLASKLEHQHPDGGVCEIQFSPDGKRLIAGDYPGGVVHTWDLATGKRLIAIDTLEGFRSSMGYFQISPDWKRIYTATHHRGTFDKVERDGKPLMRVSYQDVVHIWDAETGERLHTWQQDPPRGIIYIRLLPTGKHLILLEETPAEFESVRPRALSLFDVESRTARQIAEGHHYLHAVTDDGRLGAHTIPQPGEHSLAEAISFVRLPEWTETGRIPLGGLQSGGVSHFARDNQVAIGTLHTLPKRDDYQNIRFDMYFWDVASGKTLHKIEPRGPREQMLLLGTSPDDLYAVVSGFNRDDQSSRLLLVNLNDWSTREIPIEPRAFSRGAVFDPQGKWVAVSQLIMPQGKLQRDPEVSTLEQPRIGIIELATGKVLETLIAPQSFIMSIALSPDGRTLATAGQGTVLLWDMTTPPGELPAEPVVGQTVELAGTRIDGQPLDPAAYRGKPTLVSFWATWCTPCVAEMPELARLYGKLHERGFEVIGVSVDEQDADLPTFVEKQALPWTVLHEATPESQGMRHPLARKLAVKSVPRSFLLDGEGKIVAIDPALEELELLVEKLQAGDPATAGR